MGDPAAVFLPQGGILISDRAQTVYTLLGSCLGIVLHAPKRRLGGIAHAMFPRFEANSHYAESYYVDRALERMWTIFAEQGLKTREVVVKIFGGGSLMPHNGRQATIGEQNWDMAQKILAKLGLNLAHSEVGRDFGRKIYFDIGTGEVQVKKIQGTAGVEFL